MLCTPGYSGPRRPGLRPGPGAAPEGATDAHPAAAKNLCGDPAAFSDITASLKNAWSLMMRGAGSLRTSQAHRRLPLFLGEEDPTPDGCWARPQHLDPSAAGQAARDEARRRPLDRKTNLSSRDAPELPDAVRFTLHSNLCTCCLCKPRYSVVRGDPPY